jgi:hypothetical protein
VAFIRVAGNNVRRRHCLCSRPSHHKRDYCRAERTRRSGSYNDFGFVEFMPRGLTSPTPAPVSGSKASSCGSTTSFSTTQAWTFGRRPRAHPRPHLFAHPPPRRRREGVHPALLRFHTVAIARQVDPVDLGCLIGCQSGLDWLRHDEGRHGTVGEVDPVCLHDTRRAIRAASRNVCRFSWKSVRRNC